MIRSRKQKGTTLIELMMVVAILGIVSMVGYPLFLNITRFTRLNSARMETLSAARTSLYHINGSLRQADASTIVIGKETGQPPYSSISFTTTDGRSLKYYQEGDKLKFVNNGSTGTLSQLLRYVAFTPPRSDESTIISVSVTFEKATFEGKTKALQMSIEKVRIMN